MPRALNATLSRSLITQAGAVVKVVQRMFGGESSSAFMVDQGLGHIIITGAVTSDIAGAVLAGCRDDMASTRPGGLLADYRRSAVRLDAHQLLHSARAAFDADSPLRSPTALIVSPDEMTMWSLYCRLQGYSGVLRAAFVDEADARRWLVDQAALFAAQVNHHRRAQRR